MARTLDLEDIIDKDNIAVTISNLYDQWNMQRESWLREKQEIRNFVFATDTSTTSTNHIGWKNSTHLPKLCQIRDNLHANYMAALFPNDNPIEWEGSDEESETLEKKSIIEAYMENKLRQSNFRVEVSKLVYDWIDYGNVFAITEFIAEETIDPITGEKIKGYVGPKVSRISPEDIVFNITAQSFEQTPKIIRSIKTLGSLKADMQDHPELGFLEEVFQKSIDLRAKFQNLTIRDFRKSAAMTVDGFGSFLEYFQSPFIEILDFYGDIYDQDTQTLHKNQIITVVDRSFVIRQKTNPSWLGKSNIFHCGWRLRPDNLMAMGPLDNLVGMQYRIDHLENAKADAYDLIIHPVMKIKGTVEDFEYEPEARIFIGDDGDVEFMRPDTTMLNADTQIAIYEAKMEEMAGAPKQAMGFRTPGEKTAFEVQSLDNAANRIFVNKTAYLEEEFIEKILNSMLELARRNFSISDTIRTVDPTYGAVEFAKITKEDIVASGKIKPIGARHFARNATLIQNINQFLSSPVGMDPAVSVHVSGYRIAKLFEELLDWERFEFVQKDIRIAEMTETEQAKQAAQQIIMEQQTAGMPPQNANPMVQPPQGPQRAV